MAGRKVFDPDGFKNIEKDGKITGFSFGFKAQYYRGFTLSILRKITVNVDGEEFNREDINICIHGQTFTLDECKTVIDSEYRWEFGEFATIIVSKEGGLAAGKHHLVAGHLIAPSYMPFPIDAQYEADFEI